MARAAARRCHPVLLSPAAVVKFHNPGAKWWLSDGKKNGSKAMSAIAENFTESSKRCIACSTCRHKRKKPELAVELAGQWQGPLIHLKDLPGRELAPEVSGTWYVTTKRCLEICPLPTLQNGYQWCCLLSAGSS